MRWYSLYKSGVNNKVVLTETRNHYSVKRWVDVARQSITVRKMFTTRKRPVGHSAGGDREVWSASVANWAMANLPPRRAFAEPYTVVSPWQGGLCQKVPLDSVLPIRAYPTQCHLRAGSRSELAKLYPTS
jgi:hypothetical protein